MKRNLILTLFLSSLIGCTETKTFVITPIEKMPTGAKTAKNTSVKKYKATIVTTDKTGHKDPIRTPNYVEVYHIGPTIDVNGDLVGPHKLYRVVETSRWQLGPAKAEVPIQVKAKSGTADVRSVEKPRNYSPREEAHPAVDSQTVQVNNQDPNNADAYKDVPLPDNNPPPEKRPEIEQIFSIYPQNPTPSNQ